MKKKKFERIRAEIRRDSEIQEEWAYNNLKEKMDPDPEPIRPIPPPPKIVLRKKIAQAS